MFKKTVITDIISRQASISHRKCSENETKSNFRIFSVILLSLWFSGFYFNIGSDWGLFQTLPINTTLLECIFIKKICWNVFLLKNLLEYIFIKNLWRQPFPVS